MQLPFTRRWRERFRRGCVYGAYELYLKGRYSSGRGEWSQGREAKTSNEASSIFSKPLPETPPVPWHRQGWPIHSGHSPRFIAWRSRRILKGAKAAATKALNETVPEPHVSVAGLGLGRCGVGRERRGT